MKRKSILLLIAFTVCTLAQAQIIDNNLKAPATAPIRSLEISAIDLVSDSSVAYGSNGHKDFFHAIITSTGFGIISYQWIIRGNVGPVGNPPPPSVMAGTVTANSSGKTDVYRTVGYGSHGISTIQFRSTAPMVVLSPTRSY